MKVIKRSGKLEEFNIEKVRNALEQANGDVEESDRISGSSITWVLKAVVESIGDVKKIHVEDIQDIVENELIRLNKTNLAKHYIKYRYRQSLARDQYKELMEAVSDKLGAKNVENQNANIDEHSFGGRIGEASSLVNKHYALEFLISKKVKENHLNNRVYIHDLDHYAVGDHNCLSIPFDKLLAEGFNTRQTDVRPASSINTACQLIAVIFQLQSLNQFGGCSATHIDWTLAPYVKKSFAKHFRDGMELATFKWWKLYKSTRNYQVPKELSFDDPVICKKRFSFVRKYALKMTTKETHQAVEALYHNLNTLQSRSGNQLPFTSINYGTCTSSEGRLVTRELLNVSIEGLGKLHKTSIFPCGIFQCMKGVNRAPGDPNYDLFKLALKSTAMRLYPNYANVNWTGNAGYDVNDPTTYFSTMGCRTVNGSDINADPGVNPQTKDGRGNICPVTIIMPTIAMEAKLEADEKVMTPTGRVKLFLKKLDAAIHDAKDALIERFEWICSQTAKSAKFTYENGLLLGYKPEEGIRSALKHGTLVIGQLGLAETLELLIGCNHTKPEGMELAKEIEQLFKTRCAEFKEKHKLNFGVYYSPAENLCYTAMKKFQKQYGIIEKVSDKDYFTNSMHVPVWEEITPFEKIDVESQLTSYSSAGCITYVELPSTAIHNTEALETLVNYAMDKDIPYFAINVPNDLCNDCGYTAEMNDSCPMCEGTNITRLRRVTGYLSGDYKTAFNDGKQAEVADRTQHSR